MLKKRAITFLLLMLIMASLPVHAQSDLRLRLNLEECVDLALRNNEEIKLKHHDIYTYIAKKIEATKRYIPVINYKYRFAPVPRDLDNPSTSFFSGDITVMNQIRLEAGIPISTFGRLSINKELADLGVEAGKMQKQRKADEIIVDIHKLYNGILLARELRVLANKGLTAVQDKIRELEKEETTDQIQVLKLKAILYQIEKKLDEANKKETIALAMLKLRTGLEDDVDFDIKSKTLGRSHFQHRGFKDLLGESKENRPEWKLLSFQVLEKTKRIQLAKREYLPNLILGGFVDYAFAPGVKGDATSNTFTNPFDFFRAGVGAELRGELDFRKLKARVEEAKVEQLKAIADKRSNYRFLEIDLKNAYLEYNQNRNLLIRAEKEKRSARQIVFLTKSNLDIGLGDKKEYLEALQSYLLIQAAVYENIFNYNVSVAQLKQKIGKLYNTSKLNVSDIRN